MSKWKLNLARKIVAKETGVAKVPELWVARALVNELGTVVCIDQVDGRFDVTVAVGEYDFYRLSFSSESEVNMSISTAGPIQRVDRLAL